MSLALKEAIRIAENQLQNAGVSDAKISAKELYCFQAGIDNTRFMMAWQDILQDNQLDCYLELVQRRINREPLQHIIGVQEFMGFKFKVSPDVLIPRLDTECVVEEALKYAKGDVLDLCTGSGAIAVSVAKLADCKVTATDISEEALKIAKENAESNGAKVKFIKSDMFTELKGTFGLKKYDLIISNPPYIDTMAIGCLEPEVKDYEPMLALDGGADGLNFYRIIAEDAPKHLKPGGVLVLEIGDDQGESVPDLLKATGHFENIEVLQDLGHLDRIVVAKLIKE